MEAKKPKAKPADHAEKKTHTHFGTEDLNES
jgi:hypothetical protein